MGSNKGRKHNFNQNRDRETSQQNTNQIKTNLYE